MQKIQEDVLNKLELINSFKIKYDWKDLFLIDELKKIPRSWKHLRLDKAWIKLPKRSIYDHLVSLSRNADILIDLIDFEIDPGVLSNIIVFHDLAEVMIWDVPYFTTSELAQNLYKSKEHKDQEENKANIIILNKFEWKLKDDFKFFLENFNASIDNNELKFFNFLDRTDPIINIWKYLNIFKKEIEINKFLSAMDDFFINPNVINFSLNNDTDKLIRLIQNKAIAKEFYHNWLQVFDNNLDINDSKINLIKNIFDNREIHFI